MDVQYSIIVYNSCKAFRLVLKQVAAYLVQLSCLFWHCSPCLKIRPPNLGHSLAKCQWISPFARKNVRIGISLSVKAHVAFLLINGKCYL